MTPMHARCLREYLGLPLHWTARSISAMTNVSTAMIKSWESGQVDVPTRYEVMLLEVASHTEDVVNHLAQRAADGHHLSVNRRPTDRPTGAYPESWWRMVCVRVWHQVPSTIIA